MRGYFLPLEELRAKSDTARLLFAIAERLERIAELMEQRQQQDDREAEDEEPV